ncbi:MAG: TetR/AcrR family transcriptional regulator [Anaerolineales bacterium]|nr:TetR/AcrR family transcriptional regulator [Anaerolineales bacterium]
MTTAQRRARDKARRQQEILEAAKEVFFEKGIHQATVDDVAAQAEISKGTVYLYFQSKESILAHLLLEGLSILLPQLETAYAPQEPLSAEKHLRQLVEAYWQFAQTYPDYFRLLLALDRGRFRERVPAEMYQQILAESTRGLELAAKAIQQGAEEGAFTADDSLLTAGVLWGALNGALALMANPVRQEMIPAEPKAVFDATFELFLRGLRTNTRF